MDTTFNIHEKNKLHSMLRSLNFSFKEQYYFKLLKIRMKFED